MSGWSASQSCQTAWCWRFSCVCPTMPCWEPVRPADSGRLSPEMSSCGGTYSTATTAYHAACRDTQVCSYHRTNCAHVHWMKNSWMSCFAAAVSWFREFRRLFDCIPCVEVQTLREHTDQVLHLAFSHRGHRFSSCSKDCTVKVRPVFFLLWITKNVAVTHLPRGFFCPLGFVKHFRESKCSTAKDGCGNTDTADIQLL